MEHLMNCHGEWMWVLQALAALPVVGLYIKSRFARPVPVRVQCDDHQHRC